MSRLPGFIQPRSRAPADHRFQISVFDPLVLVTAIFIFQVLSNVVHAGVGDRQPTESSENRTAIVIESEDLEEFFDQLVPQQMQQHHIPGVVIAVVKNGETVLAKGYGYAQLHENVPVDPDKTQFE